MNNKQKEDSHTLELLEAIEERSDFPAECVLIPVILGVKAAA